VSYILIQKSHNMSNLELQSLVENLGKDLQKKYGGDYQIEGKLMNFIHSGVQVRISLDVSIIKIQVTLNLMMSAFKGTIEKEINSYLEKKIY
jgi:putative polyhydroxyalkanoate system protein